MSAVRPRNRRSLKGTTLTANDKKQRADAKSVLAKLGVLASKSFPPHDCDVGPDHDFFCCFCRKKGM
jgi:hypothetical protein